MESRPPYSPNHGALFFGPASLTRALLLAAGDTTRWGNHLDVPKHLIPIHGEPLIHRTQRQLRERGITDITVIARPEHHHTFPAPGTTITTPAPTARSWIQEWDGSRHLWHPTQRTVIIYADCYLTDALADAITTDPGDPWHVYARFTPSTITGKKYGEMFGWVITPAAHETLDRARSTAIDLVTTGQWWRALGWEVYRAAVNLPITTYEGREELHSVAWDDASDDFDTPDEWETWFKLNPHLA
jgi:hypothetical protein